MFEVKTFEFSKYGRVFLPLHLQPRLGTILRLVDMKVDTGADFTTLSKEVLYDLGYDHTWIKENTVTGDRYNVVTAAGDVEVVGLVQVSLANILGYEVRNWPFRIIMDKKRDFRNLLGRDLLAGFDYTFRNSIGQFEINRINKFTPLYDFIDGQSINEARL